MSEKHVCRYFEFGSTGIRGTVETYGGCDGGPMECVGRGLDRQHFAAVRAGYGGVAGLVLRFRKWNAGLRAGARKNQHR